MVWVKKYASILVLLSIFPVAWVIGRNFITESGTEIYDYIPQGSDIVIEVNNVNFISEFIYQRIYHEDYVMEKIDFEEIETKTGIDYMSKIVLFREQWANEHVWMAVLAYSDKASFKSYVESNIEYTNMAFGDNYAIIQLSKSSNQAKLDAHLKQIAQKEIKPFTARVDLSKYFKTDKEINCYFIPPSSKVKNHLIDGYISFDFKADKIFIDGEFTPVSGFGEPDPIAYAIDENMAFSLRSSLNIFNSIYWFSKERIKDIPEYSQLALDYDGVKLFMYDNHFGYDFPFKTFPEMQTRFDIINPKQWSDFFDTLEANGQIKRDTLTRSIVTQHGAFFQYQLNDQIFELSRNGVTLKPAKSSNVCFDMQIKVAPLIENTKLAVDQDNPPPLGIQMIGMGVAKDMIADMKVLANVEKIRFQLMSEGESKIKASGEVQMENRKGQSIIETLLFARESFYFISQAVEISSDIQSAQ